MDNMTNIEKIEFIRNKIKIYEYQIDFLTSAIKENPNGDHPEKRPRQEMLDEFIIKKQALNSILDTLL